VGLQADDDALGVQSVDEVFEASSHVAHDFVDLDDVAACSHLTTPIIALPVRSRQQIPCGDDWPGRVSAPVEVNSDRAATTSHVAAARRRMIGMVR
jgi:hypothetical protein